MNQILVEHLLNSKLICEVSKHQKFTDIADIVRETKAADDREQVLEALQLPPLNGVSLRVLISIN